MWKVNTKIFRSTVVRQKKAIRVFAGWLSFRVLINVTLVFRTWYGSTIPCELERSYKLVSGWSMLCCILINVTIAFRTWLGFRRKLLCIPYQVLNTKVTFISMWYYSLPTKTFTDFYCLTSVDLTILVYLSTGLVY